MSLIASKNREYVKEYLSIIKRPGLLDEDSKKILEEMMGRIHSLYSSKGILLDGPGDKRIGCIFSSIRSNRDSGRPASVNVFNGPPRGELHLPQSAKESAE